MSNDPDPEITIAKPSDRILAYARELQDVDPVDHGFALKPGYVMRAMLAYLDEQAKPLQEAER